MAASVIYSIDTSALVHGWRRAYPPKRFGAVWSKLDELIEQGRLVASIEVLNELKKKDDELFSWVKDRKGAMFREIDDNIQVVVVYLMRKYPKLVDTAKGKSGADPFVIAQALVGDPFHTVITGELGGSTKSPKIPFVCHEEHVTYFNLLGLIEAEDWYF